MLRGRLLVSAVLIPALVGLLYLDARVGPAAPVLFAVCVLVGLRSAWEMVLLMKPQCPELRFIPLAVAIVVLLTSVWARHWPPFVSIYDRVGVPSLSQAFVAVVISLFVVRVIAFRSAGTHLARLGAELLIVTYVGLLLSVTAELRWLGPRGHGYYALGSVIAATKMGDVGAYTLGRLFGRRKMAPYVSPGKTWMGGLGAVIGGMLGSIVWLRLMAPVFEIAWPPSAWIWAAAYGAVLALAGLFGDLSESLIKRDVGVKDSASFLPGFGGMLDLLDSILFAGPVAVMIWQTFLPIYPL